MVIIFKNKKFGKQCNNRHKLIQTFDERHAGIILQRVVELRMAVCLADISHLPPARVHELVGNKRRQFSVDVRHPYRLLFEIADDPVPLTEDGGIDRNLVTSICIIGIENTHE